MLHVFWSISDLVWFPWWLRHGAMDPFEGTPSWETLRRLDFWIDTFNLVIHWSKAEQLAFFRFSPRWSTCWTAFRRPGLLPFLTLAKCRMSENLLFQFCWRDCPQSMQYTWDKGEGHAFRCGITFFWFSWWGQPVAHPIRKIFQPLHGSTTVPSRE